MQKRSRFAKLLLGVLLLFVVTSCFYPALSIGHICVGDDCPVCLQVRLCTRLTKSLALCMGAFWLCVRLCSRFLMPLCPERINWIRKTPISLKVKISD